jgi:hypothetical protein
MRLRERERVEKSGANLYRNMAVARRRFFDADLNYLNSILFMINLQTIETEPDSPSKGYRAIVRPSDSRKSEKSCVWLPTYVPARISTTGP